MFTVRKIFILAMMLSMLFCATVSASDIVKLPAPVKSGGTPLLDAVANRQSVTDFKDVSISTKQLSNLLWVTAGVNRDDGKLTYATAMNMQDIIVYVFTKKAVYRYNPAEHNLTLIVKGDHRADTGGQPFVAKAAVDLVFVQDIDKWLKTGRQIPEASIINCGFAHTGLSMQNAYLYAASQGWGARTRMSFDHDKLSTLLGLTETQKLILMQCVGPRE